MAPKTNGTYLAPADDLPALTTPDLGEPEMAELSGVLAHSGRAPKLLGKADELLVSLRARIGNIERAAAEATARIEAEARSFAPSDAQPPDARFVVGKIRDAKKLLPPGSDDE